MRNFSLILALCAASAALAACSSPQNRVRVVSTPYADGRTHSEPVNYNGRNYRVSFSYRPAINGYHVVISAPGRAIGGTAGDRAIIEQIAKSTVRHFGCPDSQKGHIVPGSQRHANGRWTMQARCI